MRLERPRFWIVQLHFGILGPSINYWGPYESREEAKQAMAFDAKTCQIVKFTKALG